MKELPEIVLEKRRRTYLQLCRSIIGQQLSATVARVIYDRFTGLFDGVPTISQILQTPLENLQSIGLSKRKSEYIHHVCEFFIEHDLTDEQFTNMTDEEVIVTLTQIRGIGRWSAEMILMFSLAREDVFPVDDLGIRKAMIELYEIEEPDVKQLYKKLFAIADRWSPYRTYACRYLWLWYEGKK